MATFDFCENGATELERERYLAEWRAKIGYCKKHLKLNQEQKK